MGIYNHIETTMPLIQVGGFRGGSRQVEPVFAEIDEDDVERVSKFKWGKNNKSNPHTTYAQSVTGGKKIHLHRFIMGLGDYNTDKRIINHIDGNGLNNKKSNLEICDGMFNSQSFRCPNKNVGVVYYDTSMKRIKRWRASIRINKKTTSKRFETEDAAKEWLKSFLDGMLGNPSGSYERADADIARRYGL